MKITYLGHAGFCVDTPTSTIIMDPWLSPQGAFDSAWFQLPCNHHLAALVQEKLQNTSKDRYIYISHEHKDHFDIAFLNSLVSRDFKLILPHFRRAALREALQDYQCGGMITCRDGERVELRDGCITLYLDDSELNRDSSIALRAGDYCFFNMNDCKLHDRLDEVRSQQGNIDVFACQFSGATWHPTCYDYPEDVYEAISRKKMISKFQAAAKAIERVAPKMYLPSAGPSCFLDPALLHINFQRVNIFPRSDKFLAFLARRQQRSQPVYAPEIMPGDVIDVGKLDFAYRVPDRVSGEAANDYIKSYARRYQVLFEHRRHESSSDQVGVILERLRDELERKLESFTLSQRIQRALYVRFQDAEEKLLHVDFQRRKVEQCSVMEGGDYYLLTAPSWEIARVLDRKLTWEDFSLTFRMRLSRRPDVYQTLIQGFLIMEPEDLNHFCDRVLAVESHRERIIVEVAGCRYSVNRFCPHQGADLTEGWVEDDRYLVCARHHWRFDLEKGGRCDASDASIDAIALEEN